MPNKENRMKNNILDNLLPEQNALNERIIDLTLGRVLKRVYLELDEEGRKEMGKVFLSDDAGAKDRFLEKFVPKFKTIFKQEIKIIEEEVKQEIENQI